MRFYQEQGTDEWKVLFTRPMNLNDLKGMTYLEVINDTDFTLDLDEVECVVRTRNGNREKLSPDFLLQKIDQDIDGRTITEDALGASYAVYLKEKLLVFWYEFDELDAEYGSDPESNDYMMRTGLHWRNPPA